MGKPTTYVIITVNSLGDVIQPTATAAASSANGSAINASGNNQGQFDFFEENIISEETGVTKRSVLKYRNSIA